MALTEFLTNYANGSGRRGAFWLFEPWDVTERDEWTKAKFRKDGVEGKINKFGSAPHPFQSGIILENPRMAAIIASSQSGKSFSAGIDVIIQATGEIPYAFRYDKGVDTGVKREISPENIHRFGRMKAGTGVFLDNDTKAKPSNEWNCGNIVGAGKYNKEKLMPSGKEMWVGTFKQARDVNWVQFFRQNIPEHVIDHSQGVNGFYESSNKGFFVCLTNNRKIRIITYEQGYERFESIKAWRIILDEEPPDERIYASAVGHTINGITLVETPYRGMTFTYSRIVKAEGAGVKIYHCTAYDSPYLKREEIEADRITLPPWEIDARVYGLHSEQAGKPYYHDIFDELKQWEARFYEGGMRYKLEVPATNTPRDLAERECQPIVDPDGNWKIFEEPKPDKAYYISIDTARGDDQADKRVDANVAFIFRPPDPDSDEDLDFPVEVASLRTQRPTKYFAREVLSAAIWYNNAMIAPEANGFSAGTFISEIHGYPFVYTASLADDRTRKSVERIGFYSTGKKRQMLFDEFGEFIRSTIDEKYCPFKTRVVLEETLGLVVGKNGRPDHPRRGANDSVIAFAIGLYVFRFDKEQIRNNIGWKRKSKKSVDGWGDRGKSSSKETRPVLGSLRGLDARR